MTKLRKDLIELFNKLSEIETEKDRYYPSKAFKSVADSIEKCDHYLISGDRVIISNKSSGFNKVLGPSSSEIFIEWVNTGSSTRLNEDSKYLSDLDNIVGIGPIKKSILINAGIFNSTDLINLNLNIGDIIPGTNITFTQQIYTGLILWNRTNGIRINRSQAQKYINDFKLNVCNKIYVLGSYRRLKETVGDIDIVIPKSSINDDTLDKINNWLDYILVNGDTKVAGIKDKTQVDIRIIDDQYLGAHILHGTGSQEFNIKLRAYAKSLGMKLNEYGIEYKNKFYKFCNEVDVFKFLGIDYIPPELR